ncbi:MAG: hypothetical protein AAFO94_17985, partial [Bacteroidota bacterium]
MKNTTLLIIGFLLVLEVQAQDAYHSALQQLFGDNYGLPAGTWILHDTEEAILNNAGGYNVQSTVADADGQDFSKVVRFIAGAGANAWDAGYNIQNTVGIAQSEKVLLTFWIRSIDGEGEVNVFSEDASTYDKQAYLTLTVSENWTQYFIPYESTKNFGAGTASFGFHLANRAQTVEVGGFTAVKFPANIPTNQLPNKTGN